jgi:hypothetical protein
MCYVRSQLCSHQVASSGSGCHQIWPRVGRPPSAPPETDRPMDSLWEVKHCSVGSPHLCLLQLYMYSDGALLDRRLTPGVRSSWWPAAAAVGALGGPAAGVRAPGCAHPRLLPHAALPSVGSFLRWCARPVCLCATAGAAAGLGQLTRACVCGKLLSTWLGTPGWKTPLLDGWSGGAKKRRWRRWWWQRSGGSGCRGAPGHPGGGAAVVRSQYRESVTHNILCHAAHAFKR